MNANKPLIWISFLCLFVWLSQIGQNITYAQETEKIPLPPLGKGENKTVHLGEIAVTATRAAKDTFRTPNAISVIEQANIERMNAQITPLILRETVGVFAQKTTHGQGSPILRGLTGYQTYIQVDGIRLNNSTFRSGPNQYLATINPDSLRRVEVFRGPGSVLYGSGAMGGVISVFTKDADTPGTKELIIKPRLFGKFASADREKDGRLEVSGGYDRLGFIIGGGVKDVEDLRPGRGYDVQLKNRKFYLTSQKPTSIPADAWLVDVESPVGWREYSSDTKLSLNLSDNQAVKLAYQLVRQPDVPRYDSLSTKQFEVFSFAQNRDLAYANYVGKKLVPVLDELSASISYHRQKEENKQVQTGKTEQTKLSDTVGTFGLSAQGTSLAAKKQRITVGSDFYFDNLSSKTIKTDLNTKAEKIDETWGVFPDGSKFWDLNLFAQDEIQILDRLEVTLGGRYALSSAEADLSSRDKSFGVFKDSWPALTGSAGVVVGIIDELNLVGNVANSFRAPTLNDTTAVIVTNEGVDAPSLDLEPEKGLTAEGGFKARYKYFSGSLIYYFSQIKDLVARVPVEEAYKGQTLPELYTDIQAAYPGLDVFVQDNIDEAQIQGVEIDGLAPITNEWSIFGNLTFTRGKVTVLNGKAPDPNKPWESRIRREPPLNGLLGVRFEEKDDRFWGEFFARGAVKQNRLSEGDIRDPRIPGLTRDVKEVKFDENGRAIDAGTPGWFTLNIRGGMRLTEYNRLTIGIENILNRRYREHGSGVDGPGVNFIISLDNRGNFQY
ncbi:TonB-dependent receptor [Candidatus Poribacteria bacterium]|nr:TonB-dependent receptor [Candidatus Poribacteria bacterium]